MGPGLEILLGLTDATGTEADDADWQFRVFEVFAPTFNHQFGEQAIAFGSAVATDGVVVSLMEEHALDGVAFEDAEHAIVAAAGIGRALSWYRP